MRVLLAHNYYKLAGGEDVVFEAEARLLEERGHEVVQYTVDNDEVDQIGPLRTGVASLWNRRCYRDVDALCREHKPDVAHFHNTFPLMSPSVYFAAKRQGVPVVQTLHNYRLICPNALFFRDGHVCEECLGKTWSLPGIRHGCYRGSRGATAATSAMLGYHRLRGTWTRQVDAYVALTEFAKGKFIEGGLPAEKVFVKPNFLADDPGEGTGDGGFALFVGRLSVEKGLRTMLEAWRTIGARLPLKIVGTGPEEGVARDGAAQIPGVTYLGALDRDRVLAQMKAATCLVFPSECYEGVSMSLVEAMAVGLPAIASGHGSMPFIVEDNRTGLLFRPGDPRDLAAKVDAFLGSSPEPMRAECRRRHLALYSADAHYEAVMAVYRKVGGGGHASGTPTCSPGVAGELPPPISPSAT
jgi:glycosyltransferase involved in cell wall biosynthesis